MRQGDLFTMNFRWLNLFFDVKLCLSDENCKTFSKNRTNLEDVGEGLIQLSRDISVVIKNPIRKTGDLASNLYQKMLKIPMNTYRNRRFWKKCSWKNKKLLKKSYLRIGALIDRGKGVDTEVRIGFFLIHCRTGWSAVFCYKFQSKYMKKQRI